MAAVLMEEAIIQRAKYTVGKTVGTPDLYLHLYVNNHAPACNDSLGDYTECALVGYGAVHLVAANWADLWDLPTCSQTETYPTVTFTFTTGSVTIYGAYIVDNTSGDLWMAELWDTPFAVPVAGGTLTVTPVWLDMQCP